MPPARARVIFSGYVQGVGFRFAAQMLASHMPLTGYVRNLRDGTVELEAQGERSEVAAFIEQIKRRMEDYISRAEVEWREAVDGEKDFSVRD